MASDSYKAEVSNVAEQLRIWSESGSRPDEWLLREWAQRLKVVSDGLDGPNSEFSIKRAAYVLSVAVLQSDLTLDEEVRAAMDLAVSLGQDRAVMYNRPPHATGTPSKEQA